MDDYPAFRGWQQPARRFRVNAIDSQNIPTILRVGQRCEVGQDSKNRIREHLLTPAPQAEAKPAATRTHTSELQHEWPVVAPPKTSQPLFSKRLEQNSGQRQYPNVSQYGTNNRARDDAKVRSIERSAVKKTKLFLHIGHGKTGTSAIQSALAIASEDLAKRGVNYPIQQSLRNRASRLEITSGNWEPTPEISLTDQLIEFADNNQEELKVILLRITIQ